MFRNFNLRRALSVVVLLAATLLVSLPAQARPVRHAGSGAWSVTVSGDGLFAWVRSFLAALWSPKEGVTIDPNGATAPNSGLDDEGMSIDPDGRV